MGDWIGFVAITAIATRIGGVGVGLGAVSLVLSARLIPGLFLGPVAGVVIDRYNRKRIMVLCDFGRALVLCTLPFVNSLPGLFLASLLLELMTLLWSPAKESSVPKLVPEDFLPTANSLSLAAAYGTFPFASAVFAVLAKVPDWVGPSAVRHLHLTKESIALYFDALTYLVSAAVIASLVIRHQRHAERKVDQSRTAAGLDEVLQGLEYVARNASVRSVMIGLATGLIGGGMLVPLGPTFATQVLHAGSSGYGLLLTAMGVGVAVGVLLLTIGQKRVPIDRTFAFAVTGAGVSLIAASFMTGLSAATFCIGVLGLFAGAVYVLGFTSVQLNTVDEMRGRVFTLLYTLTRVCILVAFVLAPLLSVGLGSLASTIFGTPAMLPGFHLTLPGVRVTLLLAGIIIVGAGMLAAWSMRRPSRGAVAQSEPMGS